MSAPNEPNRSFPAKTVAGDPTVSSVERTESGATDKSHAIGPYVLLRKLGEGGMGQVWLAEQLHPLQRQVALKLVRAGLFDNTFIQRFLAERQSLAIMGGVGARLAEGDVWARARRAKSAKSSTSRRFMAEVVKHKMRRSGAPDEQRVLRFAQDDKSFMRFYPSVYFPRSMIFCAICWRSSIVLNSSCFARRRRMASWVRSISPSATAAMIFFAAASTFSKACVK